MRPTLHLFALDMVTNVVDYAFHLFLGRALLTGEFAVVQTVNAALLVVITTAGVLQPVVARYGAAGRDGAALFRRLLWQGALVGALLLVALWLGRGVLAAALAVPEATILPAALMVALSIVRPVVAGMLQGQERFVAFGLTRLLFALSRFGLGLLLVTGLGLGAVGGVGAYPIAALVALAAGLLWVERGAWRRDALPSRGALRDGARLSIAALIGYAAFMSLLNIDLIWVNRAAQPEVAGAYATAVVMRRVLAVLPGAVLVVFFPRVVSRVARGILPDRLLLRSGAAITASNVAGTVAYALLGGTLVRWLFGARYVTGTNLLGWMGLGMIGYGIAALWLNLFLATRPWPYVALLLLAALVQGALLGTAAGDPALSTLYFGLTGWLCALGGIPLYLLWLRPALRDAGAR